MEKNRAAVFVLFLALAARLAYFLIILHNFGSAGFYLTSNGDAVEYLSLARQWMEYGTLNSVHGVPGPEVFRMPGYPLLISFLYKFIPDPAFVVLVQNVFFVVVLGFFYKLSVSLFGNKKIVLAATLLLALEPSVIYWNNQLITETLFSSLVFLAVYFCYFFARRGAYYALIPGLLLAISIYIRPAGEYLAAVFVLFYVGLFIFKEINFRRFILSVLIFIIAFFAPLYPWMARNRAVFGSYAMSDSSAVAFGKYFSAIGRQYGLPLDVPSINNPLIDAALVRKMSVSRIAEHPMAFSRIYLLSLAPFFAGDAYLSVFGMIWPGLEKTRIRMDWRGGTAELFGFLRGHSGLGAFIFFLGKAVWIFIAASAFFGAYYWLRKYKKNYPVLLLMVFLIAYFSLASGIGSYSRFRFPVVPYIFLFASFGFAHIFKLNKESK